MTQKLRALATDFDGTLAHHGGVSETTLQAVRQWKQAGFFLILVTGRELNELQAIFPELGWFDLAVMENGVVLFHPDTGAVETLAEPPPSEFITRLHDRGLPLQIGKVIVATWEPHETELLEAIRDLGMELQVILNKGAVMIQIRLWPHADRGENGERGSRRHGRLGIRSDLARLPRPRPRGAHRPEPAQPRRRLDGLRFQKGVQTSGADHQRRCDANSRSGK